MPDATPAIATASSSWQAELELGFVGGAMRTTLAQRRHIGPLRVQRPFYPDGPVCNVYIVHPPGGVVGGDRLDVRISASAGAQVLLTTPAAGKFYRSEGREAQQTVAITLDQAQLEWLPQETIYYPGALARQKTVVQLDRGSRFIGWEVASLGLLARDQAFDNGELKLGFEVWCGARPLLIDHLRLDGAQAMMQARWGLAGRAVLGTFVACFVTREEVDALRACEAGQGDDIGLTLVDEVLVARCVGEHADAVMRRFVGLWQALRPHLMQRAAVLPRIWAT